MGKLVCIGGGEFPRAKEESNIPYTTKEIDEEIVRLSNKNNPKLLFIGTASLDNNEYYLFIKKAFENLGCTVSNLKLIDEDINFEEIKEAIFNTDIIYIGGGNTRYMLKKWNELGVDQLLIQAYNQGIVCSGLSAGSYCWFKYNYDLIEGFGVVNAINCVHYNEKDKEAKEKFYSVIREKSMEGIAIDNYVAIEFVEGNTKIIKSNPNMNAYRITYNNGKYTEETI